MEEERNVQRTEESPVGETEGGEQTRPYAGFWLRFVAVLLDGIVIVAFFSIVEPLVFGVPPLSAEWMSGLFFLETLLEMAYFVVLTAAWGQTLGKMVVGIQVVPQSGGANSWLWILFRETVGKMISVIIFFIGFLMAAFDSRKRALHDHIAQTYVVKRKTN